MATNTVYINMCFGEDQPEVHVSSCGGKCSCGSGNGDGDGDGPKEDGPTEMGLTLLGGNSANTEFRCMEVTDTGFAVGGLTKGSSALLANFDNDLNLVETASYSTQGPVIKDFIKTENQYVIATGDREGSSFLVWDGQYKSKSHVKIYYRHGTWQTTPTPPFSLNQVIKTPHDFAGEAAYICPLGAGEYGTAVVAFDNNFKQIRYVSSIKGDMTSVVADKNRVISVGWTGNSAYLADMDENLTVKKQMIFDAGKKVAFSKILKIENGYLIVGEVTDQSGKISIILLNIDEELSIIKKKVIEGLASHYVRNVTIRPKGGYLISGECDTLNTVGKEAFIIALSSNLTIDKALQFGGTANDGAYSAKQIGDGTYVVVGYTKSVGALQDGFIATFKGEFIDLDRAYAQISRHDC